MENVTTTDCLASGACARHVIDFDNFDRLDIAVFGQAGGCRRDLTPPIRCACEFGDVVHHHNQIRLSGAPFDAVVEYQRLWRISDISLRGAGTGPGRYCSQLFIVQGRIVFVILNANILLHIPGRHGAGSVSESGLIFDQPCIRGDLLEGHEWHRPSTTIPVAALTAALENGFNVLVECDFFRLGQQGNWHAQQRCRRGARERRNRRYDAHNRYSS